MRGARQSLAGTRSLAAGGLLAAALAFGGLAPGAAAAQDCDIRELDEPTTTSDLRNDSNRNFECIRQRLEVLEAKRDELEQRLEQVERQGAGEPGVYRNVDGQVVRDERHHAPATFVLTGDRQGRPRSLGLDRARVLEMCGDAEGCLLTLGLRGLVIGDAPVRAMFTAGPCHFHLEGEEGHWALSGLCAPAGLPRPPGDAAEAEESAADGGAALWGRDGDARPLGGSGQASRVILGFGGACYLAEAPPETRSTGAGGARLARDTRPDLFLVTAGTGWDPEGAFPAALLPLGLGDPDFRCSLTIRD